MSYSDFTLQSIEATFGVVARTAPLFAELEPMSAPSWLQELLERSLQLPLVSEKARSELIVMPVLLACRELSNNAVAIFSGPRLDVSPEQGLVGECDFILAKTAPIPELRAPLIAVVEAKKNDVESGIGQCVAQLIGARLFNEQTGQHIPAVYGCVTTGEVWQFLRLEAMVATIDRHRLYLDNLPGILGTFRAIIATASANP
ncbi:MAG TPA: hypothetical protein VE999_18875 [Gemmataceae bacterium]|nr:hypothetical protein [Gemmataceae bacterium]